MAAEHRIRLLTTFPLGGKTITARWYARYRSVVRTLPLGGKTITARWYVRYLSVFNIWGQEKGREADRLMGLNGVDGVNGD